MTTESTAFVLWQPGIPKHQDMRIGNRKAVGVCHIGKNNNKKGAFRVARFARNVTKSVYKKMQFSLLHLPKLI